MPSRRELIVSFLEGDKWSAQDLANYFKIELREILDDLTHLKRSIKHGKLIVEPAFCKTCGFIFKERSKVKRPCRCPKCKAERVEAPLFRIKY